MLSHSRFGVALLRLLHQGEDNKSLTALLHLEVTESLMLEDAQAALKRLHALRELGYAYAIIGSAGPVDFYLRTLPAMLIPDSHPGIYPQPVDK